jgi:hypothetical protein
MRPSNWTPERDALLCKLRASDMPRPEILARINDGFDPKVTVSQMQERARTISARRGKRVASKPDGANTGTRIRTDDAYRAMSDEFARAGSAVQLQVVEIKAPARQGIMRGKPPNHAEMVAAKVAQCSQSRRAVGPAFVRGLE